MLLFCIDASESMITPIKTEDLDEEAQSPMQKLLEAAVELQKRKVVASPNDLVGIMFYNTVCFRLATDRHATYSECILARALRDKERRRDQEPLLCLPTNCSG